jgi:hypothetical protein
MATIKKKMQAGGVSKKSPKAPMVDPNGAWTKVQQRNLPPAPMKKGGKVKKAKDGNWIQKATASIKKRGTEGKCTPITKPGCTGKAKALAKTFKKMAKARKGK